MRKNLKTIGQVARELEVEPHVLRFWEASFPQLRPLKINTRRFYRDKDINTLSIIKDLLYTKGYTIRGARRCFSKLPSRGDHVFLLTEILEGMESSYKKLIAKIK